MSVIGEAFVRVRPDTAGFQREAEGHVSKAGKELGRIFAASFAIAGVAEGIKSVVEAAASHQAAFAVLDTTIKNAGAANDLYGQSIESLLEKEARLKGFSDEELASSFQRLVSVTHDSSKAFKDLQLAEDLARFRHIDLATAALAVSKAEQGSYTALQRYGVIVPKAAAETLRLKQAHDAAVASGAKFTEQQKEQYKAALATAAAHDKTSTAAAALALVEQRTGGASAAYAKTAAGQWDRLHQDVHQAEVAIGTELLPGLTSAAEGLGAFIQKETENKAVQQEVRQAAHDVARAFGLVKDVVETVGPPLVTVADDIGGVTKSLEALGIAIGTYKLATALAGIGAAETTVGTDAEVASGRVALLKTNLLGLGKIAAIAIPIELVIHRKGIGDYLGKEIKNLTGSKLLGDITRIGTQHGLIDILRGHTDELGVQSAGSEAAQAWWTGFSKGRPSFVGQVIAEQANEAVQKAGGSFGSGAFAGALAGGLTAAASDPKVTKAGNDAGKAAIKSLRDGIAADKTDLDQLKKDMAAAVTQGAEAVDQAVQSAKQNFNSIGQDLAASIYAIIDKPVTDAQTRLSEQQNKFWLYSARLTLKNLGEAVLLPGGKSLSRDPREAVKQLTALDRRHASPALEEFIREYEQAALGVTGARLQIRQASADKVNVRTQRRIADLTDEHNRGLITTAQFNVRLRSVLGAAGVSRGRALDVLGVAGADRFSADLQGLGLQAAASAAGPQRSGSGLVPTIVRPLETLQQTQKEIAGIAKEQRDKQLDETRKQTKLLGKIAGDRAASKFTSSLSKNPGAQTRRSKELVGVSG